MTAAYSFCVSAVRNALNPVSTGLTRAFSALRFAGTRLALRYRTLPDVTVTDVVGLRVVDAYDVLLHGGLRPMIEPPGWGEDIVIRQRPVEDVDGSGRRVGGQAVDRERGRLGRGARAATSAPVAGLDPGDSRRVISEAAARVYTRRPGCRRCR